MSNVPVHIDISQEIVDWQQAVHGEEVRSANVSALTKLQTQANAAIDYVTDKGQTIDNTVTEIEEVRRYTEEVQQEAEQAVIQAQGYVQDAAAEVEKAKEEAVKSDNSALKSQSWAIGGTGSREGEDGNNSKYFSEKSKEDADRATVEADRAAQYANIVAPGFYVDPISMCLYMKGGVGVSFIVTDDNVLCWKIA